MTYGDDEGSVEDSEPHELVEITMGAQVFRLTMGDVNVTVGGDRYVASACDRTEAGISSTGSLRELSLLLPSSHPLAQRWFSMGIPPKGVSVVIRRYQTRSGQTRFLWRGKITSASPEDQGKVTRFLIPSRIGQMLGRKLPTFTAGRNCPHVLYDTGTCRAVRGSFTQSTTVVSVEGITVVVAGGSALTPVYWAKFGKIVDLTSGQSMMVVDCVTDTIEDTTTLTLQLPLQELEAGASVEVERGCDHTMTDCSVSFDNAVNFGGFNFMPTNSPFRVNGFGVVEQF